MVLPELIDLTSREDCGSHGIHRNSCTGGFRTERCCAHWVPCRCPRMGGTIYGVDISNCSQGVKGNDEKEMQSCFPSHPCVSPPSL